MLRTPWRASRYIAQGLRTSTYHRPSTLSSFAGTHCVRSYAAYDITPQPDSSKIDATQTRNATKPGFALRPYQEECVQTCLQALEEGRRQIGVSLATGSGKTVIFTELIGRVPSQTEGATQTLILVHRRELVEQAARHVHNRYPEKTVDIEMGKLHASGHADVTVASIQSINSRDRIDKFDPSRFKLILVDEAHHIVASTYLNVLGHFGLNADVAAPTAPALIGVSATMARFDGLALGKAIKHIVFHLDYIHMIGESWLSNVIFTTVQSTANVSRVTKSSTGDFQVGSLSRIVNTNKINEITVRSWIAKAGERKSTLVFCVDLAHVMHLTNTFRRYGYDAHYITGDTPVKVREQILTDFKERRFPVLLNCGVFTEGTDIPNIDCVLLARPTRSRNLLVQMIGRGMRLYPGKENCHIIDMVASLEGGIITTPTLFGLDPDAVLEHADRSRMSEIKDEMEFQERQLEEAAERNEAAGAEASSLAANTTVTFKDYESVLDLISDTSGERHVRAISQYAWTNVGPDKYILGNGGSGSYISLEHEDLWRAKYVMKLSSSSDSALPPRRSKSPFSRPVQIARSESFEGIIRAADTFAGKTFTHSFIAYQAPWRRSAASQSQADFINRFREEIGEEPIGYEDLTKGFANDMITKIIHGAKGRFASISAAKRRDEKKVRQAEKVETLRKNERVTIGPLTS